MSNDTRLAEENRRLREENQKLRDALREAEAGLEFAGATTVHVGKGRFVPAPNAALHIVREALKEQV